MMEAFRKAREADTKSHWRCRDEIAKDYWRAALEWAVKDAECNGEGYGCMLAAKIDEELENLNEPNTENIHADLSDHTGHDPRLCSLARRVDTSLC